MSYPDFMAAEKAKALRVDAIARASHTMHGGKMDGWYDTCTHDAMRFVSMMDAYEASAPLTPTGSASSPTPTPTTVQDARNALRRLNDAHRFADADAMSRLITEHEHLLANCTATNGETQ